MTERKTKYATILADPPWDVLQKGGYGATKHYELMTLDRIKAMPVADLASDKSHLYLWCTNASLRAGYDVMAAWGFQMRSVICWPKWRLGLGTYFRNCSEHLLFGTRGKAPVLCNKQPNIISGPVLRHSEKPLEQYPMIKRMSSGPFLELFARHREPGFDIWGLEAPDGSDISIPGYPVPSSPETRKLLLSKNEGADHA